MNLDFENHDRLLGFIPWFILLSIGNANNIRYTYYEWIWTQIYFTRLEILFIFISSFQITNSYQESVYIIFYSPLRALPSLKFSLDYVSNTLKAMIMMSVSKHAVLIIDSMKPINHGDFSVRHM